MKCLTTTIIIGLFAASSMLAGDAGEVKLKIPATTLNRAMELMVRADILAASDHLGGIGFTGYSINLRNPSITLVSPNIFRVNAIADVRAGLNLVLFAFDYTASPNVILEGTVETVADGLGGFSLELNPTSLDLDGTGFQNWLIDLFSLEDQILAQFPELRLASYTSLFPGQLSEYFEEPIPDVRFENNSIVVFMAARPYALIIRDVEIDGTLECTAECRIFVGPGVVIRSTADILLRAGKDIDFHEDVITEDGAQIETEIDPTLIGGVVITEREVDRRDALTQSENGRVEQAPGDQFVISDVPLNANTWNINDVRLLGSKPNPFRESATISFYLRKPMHTTLRVYDMFGRRVAELVNAPQYPAGYHDVQFNGHGLPAGKYLYTLQAGKYTKTGSMTLGGF